jgi:hypothetical protein
MLVTVYASSTARTAFSGIPNQSFVGPSATRRALLGLRVRLVVPSSECQ